MSERRTHDTFAWCRRPRDLGELDVACAMLSPKRLSAFSICLARIVADDAESAQLIVSTLRAYLQAEPWDEEVSSCHLQRHGSGSLLTFRSGESCNARTPLRLSVDRVIDHLLGSSALSGELAWTCTSSSLLVRAASEGRSVPPVGKTLVGGLAARPSERPTVRATAQFASSSLLPHPMPRATCTSRPPSPDRPRSQRP
jgi:hypothetical protein